MNENWLPIPGFEGVYEVSDLGRVKSLARAGGDGRTLKTRILRGRAQASGHLSIGLGLPGGQRRNALVHRLVLTAFVGPPPDGMHALHGDGNPANNSLENLRWGTPSENSLDAVRHGAHPQTRKTHCKHGHEFTPGNTRLDGRNGRVCRECERLRSEQKRLKDPEDTRRYQREYKRRWRAERGRVA